MTMPKNIESGPHNVVSLAIAIAKAAHAGQTDHGGIPYIQHPMDVMKGVWYSGAASNPDSGVHILAAAALHDVVEDTPVTLGDLSEAGITHRAIMLTDAMTRRDGETYWAYIKRLKADESACVIKAADLLDNTRTDRGWMPDDSLFRDRYVRAFTAVRSRAPIHLIMNMMNNATTSQLVTVGIG